MGSGRFENQQHFVNPPMLHELGFLLRIVCEEIVKYKLWPVSQLLGRFRNFTDRRVATLPRRIAGFFVLSYSSTSKELRTDGSLMDHCSMLVSLRISGLG